MHKSSLYLYFAHILKSWSAPKILLLNKICMISHLVVSHLVVSPRVITFDLFSLSLFSHKYLCTFSNLSLVIHLSQVLILLLICSEDKRYNIKAFSKDLTTQFGYCRTHRIPALVTNAFVIKCIASKKCYCNQKISYRTPANFSNDVFHFSHIEALCIS